MRAGTWLWVLVVAGCARGPSLEAPQLLDFGSGAVGADIDATLVVTNLADVDDVLKLQLPSGFSAEATERVVPRNSRVVLAVRARVTTLGLAESTAVLEGREFRQQVVLRVRGTGPRLEVVDTLTMPPIPILNGVSSPSQAVLRVRNVGTPGSKLRFASPLSDGPELCAGTLGTQTAVCAPIAEVELEAGAFVEIPLTLKLGLDRQRSWQLTFDSNDPVEPTRTVRVVVLVANVGPCVFALPPIIPVGANGATVRLAHAGSEQCFLRSMTLELDPPEALRFADALTFPRLVQPGEVITRTVVPVAAPQFRSGLVHVRFEGGALDAVLRPSANDNPCLLTSPTQLDFGGVAIGCVSASRSVQVYNLCPTPLVLSDAATGTAEFGVSQFTPTELHAGGAPAVVSVRFAPQAATGHADTLTLTGGGRVFVPLTGFVERRRGVDRFRQELAQSRVLFLVDTSPSFAPTLPAVRQQLEALLQYLAGACVDATVAFAPAEGLATPGLALNDAGTAWTTNRQPDFVGRALSAFDALPPGTESEACIGPAAALLGGFADAGVLSGVCITDALEQSPDAGGSLAALRAVDASFTWNAVTGTSASTCPVEAHDDDLVHRALVQATNGVRAEVCGAWSSDFIPTGTFECGYRTVFFLSSPARGGIEVRVDGQLVTSGWTWDAVQNAVNFDPLATPRPGSTLEISYDAACIP